MRRLGIALLVVFVALGIPWTYFSVTLGLKLERELQAIRDRGEPLTLEQAAPEMPPPSENAALIYNEIFRLEDWAFGPGTRPEVDPTPPLLFEIPERLRHALLEQEGVEHPGEPQREALRDPTVQKIFELLEAASHRPRCVLNVPWEEGPMVVLLPQGTLFRNCARLLAVRIRVAGQDGRSDEVLVWTHVGLTMAGHVRQGPTLIEQDSSYSIGRIILEACRDAISAVQADGAIAQQMASIPAAAEISRDFSRALLGERAMRLWLFRQMGPDLMQGLMGDDRPGWRQLWWLYGSALGTPVRRYDGLACLRLFAEVIDEAGDPWRDFDVDYYWHVLAPMTSTIFPHLSQSPRNRDAAIARHDQFQIALALNLYRQAHGGYPETLAQLAEVVDWPIPDDIFSGEPFRYRREGAGYVLWSLGPDLDDDGGQDFRGEGRSWDDSDIVWRVEG